MSTQTEIYKGYKIEITQDECAENPFEAWDCEPPLLAYYGGRHSDCKSYQGAPKDWYDILRLMPAAIWKRGQRVAFLKEFILPLGLSLRDYAEEVRRVGEIEACAVYLGEHLGEKPEGWRSAIEWFEMAESLLNYAGIQCLNTQSNGYCQGDSTLLLIIATPDFLSTTGVQPEHVKECLQGAADLYSAWAWGDVYGIASITAPGPLDEDGDETEGEELSEGSVWGFYGRDHEKSGLMESARDSIDWHIEKQAKEQADILAMVSAD